MKNFGGETRDKTVEPRSTGPKKTTDWLKGKQHRKLLETRKVPLAG